jgi:hypothetical protein
MKSLDNNIRITPESLKKIGTIAGVVSVIIVAYYATGLYRNYLQIKKLKEQEAKPLGAEEM